MPMLLRNELRENTIEHVPNPKKRQLMHSASSAASGSGQQRVKGSATDAEPEAQIRFPALAANTRIAGTPAQVAITPQEGVDGHGREC